MPATSRPTVTVVTIVRFGSAGPMIEKSPVSRPPCRDTPPTASVRTDRPVLRFAAVLGLHAGDRAATASTPAVAVDPRRGGASGSEPMGENEASEKIRVLVISTTPQL